MTTSTSHIERIESPIGRIEIIGDGSQITALSMERGGMLPHDEAPEHPDALTGEAARQLREYFAGERTEFDLPVRLVGSAFQHAVWEQIAAIPWGSHLSYGEIGLAIGKAHSGRAIGQAVGANPVPLIIGCHRVLSSTDRITGYSGGNGVPTKIWLLDHEGIAHHGAATALFDLEAVTR